MLEGRGGSPRLRDHQRRGSSAEGDVWTPGESPEGGDGNCGDAIVIGDRVAALHGGEVAREGAHRLGISCPRGEWARESADSPSNRVDDEVGY